MTDDAFLGYFVAGIDILGHRVTARIGRLNPGQATEAGFSKAGANQFVIQIDHRDEVPIEFAPEESLASRMAKVDAAVERWRILH